MWYDKDTLREQLTKMKPDERLRYLEQIELEAKRKLQQTKELLEESHKLMKKNKEQLLKQAIEEGEQMLRDRTHRDNNEQKREELSQLLQQKQDNLEGQVHSSRLPVSHPVVGLYSQLRGIQYSYKDDPAVDYARATLLPEIRHELIEVLSKYREVPDAMKEIADAAYRLTKDLLGESEAERKKYLFP